MLDNGLQNTACTITCEVVMPEFQIRSIQTSAVRNDIDSAAKYIGAGAATVGVAGSGGSFGYLAHDNSLS